jgi:hypothetical protein
MVSFDAIRSQFKLELAKKPRGLTYDELNEIIQSVCRVSSDDEHLFMRFDFWMRHKNHSEQIICANVELVRFGVLAVRPARQTSKENSGSSKNPSFSHPAMLDKFLQRVYVEPKSVSRRSDTVEARAKIVDNWVKESIDSKDRIDLPPLEDIQPEGNIGNNRPSDMKYISFEQLVKCIARSENASALKDYAMNLMALLKIYQEELMIAKDNAIQMKDDKIDGLLQKLDAQSAKMDKLSQDNEELKTMANQLLVYGKNADIKLDHVQSELKTANDKLDKTAEFTISFAKMALPMWVGSTVIKTQMEKLIKDSSIEYALTHLKLMFAVRFYELGEDSNQATMITYLCNTNFKKLGDRMKELYERHQVMYMLKPEAVCLMSGEINMERTDIKNMKAAVFPSEFIDQTRYLPQRKCYQTSSIPISELTKFAESVIGNIRCIRFHGYQDRMDKFIKNGECEFNPAITDYISQMDRTFHSTVIPFCQEYIDCYLVERTDIESVVPIYKRKSPSTRKPIRSEFDNQRMMDREYVLFKLNAKIVEDTSVDTIDSMVMDGIITKNDLPALKKIAEVEKVDTSDIVFPDSSSDDDSMPPLLTDDEDDGYNEDGVDN